MAALTNTCIYGFITVTPVYITNILWKETELDSSSGFEWTWMQRY